MNAGFNIFVYINLINSPEISIHPSCVFHIVVLEEDKVIIIVLFRNSELALSIGMQRKANSKTLCDKREFTLL